MLIGTWRKNGLRLRILGEITGRHGEMRLQVQKETANGMHGIFSLSPSEIITPSDLALRVTYLDAPQSEE